MLLGVTFFISLMFALIFSAAGRWDYWQGWLYFFLYSYLEIFAFAVIPAELVPERYRIAPGTKDWDKLIFLTITVLGNLVPLLAALDGGRYHWSGDFPLGVNIAAFIIIFLGYSLMIVSLHRNKFFAATVRIQTDRGHYVVDRGPYALIRHPGYAGLIIAGLALPPALNSWWALLPAALFVGTILIRTCLEDLTLQQELPGYSEYVARVRYRLLPGVW